MSGIANGILGSENGPWGSAAQASIFATANAGSLQHQTSAHLDLERYKDVPRCQNCRNLEIIERTEGIVFKKTTRRWACRLGRPDFITSAVICYGDAEDMRKFGPCGPDGKLFEKK